MEAPIDGRQILDMNEFQANVKKFTHVAVFRNKMGGYWHHYLVLDLSKGGVSIIHYTGGKDARKAFCLVQVRIEDLQYRQKDTDLFDFDSGLYFIKRPNYPSTEHDEEIAYKRALSRRDEKNYSLSNNNCEHLVTWILTGQSICEQLKNTGKSAKADVMESLLRKETAAAVFTSDMCTKGVVAGVHFVTKSGKALANIVKAAKDVAKAGTVMAEQTVDVIKTTVTNGSRAGASAITSGITCGISAAIAAPIEFGFAAFSIYKLYQQKKEGHINSKQFYRETTKTITGSISSVGASTLGGFIGGFLGSFIFPGVGTAVGSILGGVIGGLLGRICGSTAAGRAYDAIKGK